MPACNTHAHAQIHSKHIPQTDKYIHANSHSFYVLTIVLIVMETDAITVKCG